MRDFFFQQIDRIKFSIAKVMLNVNSISKQQKRKQLYLVKLSKVFCVKQNDQIVYIFKPKNLLILNLGPLSQTKLYAKRCRKSMNASITNIRSLINKLLDQQAAYIKKILFPYLLSISKSQQLCPIQRLNSKINIDGNNLSKEFTN